MEKEESYKPHEDTFYLGMAIDPIHIGTGGYRLGRIDNTIARDPTTNVPIFFGSSIEGTARTYSAYALVHSRKDRKYLKCAGKTSEENENMQQCGKCEICITYGFSNKDKSLHGMAQFSDAQLLFFPVHTMVGPVWVTCPKILDEMFMEETTALSQALSPSKNGSIEEKVWICPELEEKTKGKLNLGWLYMETLSDNTIELSSWEYREGKKLESISEMQEILKRLTIVSNRMFAHIVNSNLEVRTSVSINPETGAAEEGALFTYEAIPRGTVMYFAVTYLNPGNFGIEDLLSDMNTVRETVENGLRLFQYLGIGGMGTRGFGRFRIFELDGDQNEE